MGDNELPRGFDLSVRVAEIRAKVELEGLFGPRLTVSVEPNHVETAQTLFGALSNWASDIEAPRWQRKWSSFSDWAAVVLFMWILVGAGVFPLSNWGEGGRNFMKQEGRKLLANGGISEKNEKDAIGLILALESDYNPSNYERPSLGIKYWSYVLLGGSNIGGAISVPQRMHRSLEG